MNDSLAISTRRYLAIALVIHVLVSLQYYAGWPFDGLCPTDEVCSSSRFFCLFLPGVLFFLFFVPCAIRT